MHDDMNTTSVIQLVNEIIVTSDNNNTKAVLFLTVVFSMLNEVFQKNKAQN